MRTTRDGALNAVKILSGIRVEQVGTGAIHDAIQRICEYIEQDPDPDGAVWAEIDELLVKLSGGCDSGDIWNLVRSGPVGKNRRDRLPNWRIVTRDRGLYHWESHEARCWANLSGIRDQLRKLATARGLLVPSLGDMVAIAKGLPNDAECYLSAEQAAQFKAFFAAQVEKGGG